MSDPARLAEFMSRTPFFGGLMDESLSRVISLFSQKRVEAGTTIFKEGESGRSMYVIEKGDLVVYRNGPSGRPVKMMHMGPGAFFGETTLIEMQPRPHTVVAETAALLHELTNNGLYTLYKTDLPAYVMVLQNINRELCRRIRKADGRVADWADESDDPTTQLRTREDLGLPPARK